MEDYRTTFNDQPTDTPTHIHLSFQALCGAPSAHTFSFDGYIGHLPVTILIDTGSSHNIIQPHLALHLQLCTVPITPFQLWLEMATKFSVPLFALMLPFLYILTPFPFLFTSYLSKEMMLSWEWTGCVLWAP